MGNQHVGERQGGHLGMEAKSLRAVLARRLWTGAAGMAVAALMVQAVSAASVRTRNFIVTARDVAFARQVADAAEQYRASLAIEWLETELPPWPHPCPIAVQEAKGAGGATSFIFRNGTPTEWTMSIQGSRERILDSVLPHEITHTVFATHFGRPVPRWADEGACTTVEHLSERAKQQEFLLQFLTTGRGIPFNSMFRMTEYPHDIMPLYSQGHSVAQYLLEQGSKRQFVDFVGLGMRTGNWDQAIHQSYGFEDLSELQVTWIAWVRQGSPSMNGQNRLPTQALATTRSGGSSWYAKQRNAPRPVPTAQGLRQVSLASRGGFSPLESPARRARQTARAQPPQQVQEQVMEWDDDGPQTGPATLPTFPPGYAPSALPVAHATASLSR